MGQFSDNFVNNLKNSNARTSWSLEKNYLWGQIVYRKNGVLLNLFKTSFNVSLKFKL